MNTDIEQFAERLIQNDVLCCDSALVDVLLRHDIVSVDDMEGLTQDVDELEWVVWSCGHNMPGCLPDSEPLVHSLFADAVQSIVDTMDDHAQDDDISDELLSEYVSAIKEAQNADAEFSLVAGGRVYWVTQDTMTTDELRSAVGASSRWWDAFDDGFETVDGFSSSDDLVRDPLEWWRVTDLLARDLRGLGEVILETDFGTWWGRCTSGQSIIQDGVFQRVAQLIESRIAKG